MKPLAIWIAVVAVVFGGYALVTSLVRDTEQVFVVVDTSFFMEAGRIRRAPRTRSDRRRRPQRVRARHRTRPRARTLVHSWQDQLRLGGFQAFGPCSFDGIDQFPEADRRR